MNEIRHKPIIIALSCLTLLLACSEENTGDASILEGKWKSQCVPVFSQLGFSNIDPEVMARRIQYSFSDNTFSIQVLEYNDNQCNTEATVVEASESDIFALPFNAPDTFVIGEETTTVDDDIVTRIDLTYIDGSTKKDIFLLQDNTLYFGTVDFGCLFAASTTEELQQCNDVRPDKIEFTFGFAQQGEPVVQPPTPGEPPVFNTL